MSFLEVTLSADSPSQAVPGALPARVALDLTLQLLLLVPPEFQYHLTPDTNVTFLFIANNS